MHSISIPEYAVRTAMRRNGKLRKYQTLEPTKTALLVIDMQNAFLLPGMAMELPHGRDIIPNINRVAATVRECGGIVVWIQVNHAAAAAEWTIWFDLHMSPGQKEQTIRELTPGHVGYELHAKLDAQPDDVYIEKIRLSAFVGDSSNLHQELQRRGIDSVIITGALSNGCCESTARDAMQLNYRTIFVSDANATRTDEEHNATLGNMVQTFADVLSTEEVCVFLREQAESSPEVRAE